MIKLSILGPAELRKESGVLAQSFLSGPKRLALLAYLALSHPQGFQRRDVLLPLFWPHHDQQSARNALSNMLYHIRSSLGNDTIINRGNEEIGLNALWCDAHAFEAAIAEGNFKEAYNLYRGPLLEGLHAPDVSAGFQQWLDNEREKLSRGYFSVLEKLAREAESKKDFITAADWWYKLNQKDRYNSVAVKRLMEVLLLREKRKEALKVAEDHVGLLEDELGADATEEMEELLRHLDQFEKRLDEEQEGALGVKRDPDPRTIAVMPFESINKGEDADPFASGLHYDLLTRLYKIPSLTVIARNSVLQLQDKEKSISEIAGKLGAGTIVEGSVQYSDQRIRLYVQLIDARKERLIWADTYDCEFTQANQFDIQGELAEKVIEKLRLRIRAIESVNYKDEPSTDIETYHLFVQAQTYLARRTERSIQRALSYFQKAVDRDRKYAAAWAGLAEALLLLDYYAYSIPEGYADITTIVQQALVLGPDLADSHVSMGIRHVSMKEGAEAVQEFEKAIALQPGSAKAYNWLGWLYMVLGKPEEAIYPGERAAELNPMAPYVRAYLGEIYLAAGRYEKALSEARTARQMQPEMALTHFLEGLCLYHLDLFSESLLALDEAMVLVRDQGIPSETEVMAILALAYHADGNRERTEELFKQIRDSGDECSVGLVLAASGNTEEAMIQFSGIDTWGDLSTPFIRYLFPEVLKPIREEGQFEEIIEQVNRSWGIS